MEDEAQNRGVIATEVDKNPLPQSDMTDTVDETISTESGPVRRKKEQREGSEDNRTTEEYVGGRNLTTLPRLNVSTDGLSKEHPISLNSSSPATPQWTVWDKESEIAQHERKRRKEARKHEQIALDCTQ